MAEGTYVAVDEGLERLKESRKLRHKLTVEGEALSATEVGVMARKLASSASQTTVLQQQGIGAAIGLPMELEMELEDLVVTALENRTD